MSLVIGTNAGLVRAEALPFEAGDAEPVLDGGRVADLGATGGGSALLAATASGLYRSTDDGRSWTRLALPGPDRAAWSVSTIGGAVYAGTDDPYLYRSRDGGDTWQELTGFRDLPSRGHWASPRDEHRARLRTLASPPGRPSRLLAGVEAGGFHVSDDGGHTWQDYRGALADDVHQLVALGSEVYVAATGFLDLALNRLDIGHGMGFGGVHRTVDGGETWTRLDRGNEHAYVRSVHVHGGRLHFCGARRPPPDWGERGIDTVLFESSNLGRTLDRVDYPGQSDELVEAWAVVDGHTVAGTRRYESGSGSAEPTGRVLRRRRDRPEYDVVGRTEAPVTSLQAV